MVTGVVPSLPRSLPSVFIAHRVQQSPCSSIFHRVLLTHALAFSANQFVHEKKSQRIYTSMHSAGLELTKLTSTRLEDNHVRHWGDRHYTLPGGHFSPGAMGRPALPYQSQQNGFTICKRCYCLLYIGGGPTKPTAPVYCMTLFNTPRYMTFRSDFV